MANTPIYGWETPDDTDYVYQGAAAARTTANAIDSTLSTQLSLTGYGKQVYTYNTTANLVIASTGTATMFTAPSFTGTAGRLYQVTYTVGNLYKSTNAGAIQVILSRGTSSDIDTSFVEGMAVGSSVPFSKTLVMSGTQIGTTAFIPTVRIAPNTNGCVASNTGGIAGCISIVDIGTA